MPERHPVCNHTLSAARSKESAFRVEAEIILRNGVTKKSLDRLVMAAVRIFTDIEHEDMAEVDPPCPNWAGYFTDGIRR